MICEIVWLKPCVLCYFGQSPKHLRLTTFEVRFHQTCSCSEANPSLCLCPPWKAVDREYAGAVWCGFTGCAFFCCFFPVPFWSRWWHIWSPWHHQPKVRWRVWQDHLVKNTFCGCLNGKYFFPGRLLFLNIQSDVFLCHLYLLFALLFQCAEREPWENYPYAARTGWYCNFLLTIASLGFHMWFSHATSISKVRVFSLIILSSDVEKCPRAGHSFLHSSKLTSLNKISFWDQLPTVVIHQQLLQGDLWQLQANCSEANQLGFLPAREPDSSKWEDLKDKAQNFLDLVAGFWNKEP